MIYRDSIWRDREGRELRAEYRQPLPPRTEKRPGDLELTGKGEWVRVAA